LVTLRSNGDRYKR